MLKEYIGTKEIQIIAECGYEKANDLRKQITNNYCQNWLLSRYKIPTEFLLKELRIDINKIYEKAKLEKELNKY